MPVLTFLTGRRWFRSRWAICGARRSSGASTSGRAPTLASRCSSAAAGSDCPRPSPSRAARSSSSPPSPWSLCVASTPRCARSRSACSTARAPSSSRPSTASSTPSAPAATSSAGQIQSRAGMCRLLAYVAWYFATSEPRSSAQGLVS
eukprot:3095863-Rhodomonas_salina.1